MLSVGIKLSFRVTIGSTMCTLQTQEAEGLELRHGC